MNDIVPNTTDWYKQMGVVNKLITLQVLAQKDSKIANIDLDKQILALNHSITKAMAEQTKQLKEKEVNHKVLEANLLM